jgi:Gluconate 2-dehydrogenase subunit 3
MKHDDRKFEQDHPVAGFSRRDWLLNFGSSVILSGFAGLPGESQQKNNIFTTALPPGLYTPSIDHVTHALNQDGPFCSIPPGAETQFVRPRSGPFLPQAFSAEEFTVIRRLVELILGEDLKAATAQQAAGAPASLYDEVAEWIDLIVSSAPGVRAAARNLTPEQRALAVAYFTSEEPVHELETFEPERICKEGMAWLQQESGRRSFRTFLTASPSTQFELLSSISDSRPDPAVSNAGTRFFAFLKVEVVRGYYTSRLGLRELNYTGNSFYGRSPGCGSHLSLDDNTTSVGFGFEPFEQEMTKLTGWSDGKGQV